MAEHEIVYWLFGFIGAMFVVWSGVKVAVDWRQQRITLHKSSAEASAEIGWHRRLEERQRYIDDQTADIITELKSEVTLLRATHEATFGEVVALRLKLSSMEQDEAECRDQHAQTRQRLAKLEEELSRPGGMP